MRKNIIILVSIICCGTVMSQCEGGHSTDWSDAWVSCTGQENPNPDRAEEHWILYDFGAFYQVDETHIWNFNVFGETEKGIQDIVIDWSVDGNNWTDWGGFTVAEAPGDDDYIGEPGPNLEGFVTRYLLISIQSNWGDDDCQGFAEIKFNVQPAGVFIDEPQQQDFTFLVYPNPANNQLTVELERGQPTIVSLIDATGKEIYAARQSHYRFTIPVQDIAEGVYFLRILDEDDRMAISRVAIFH